MPRTRTRYAVRKLDLDDPYFNVVDTRVEGWELLAQEAIVDRYTSHRSAIQKAAELNRDGE